MLHSLERKFKPVVHIVRFQVSCELCGKGLWGHHNRSMRVHLFYPLHYRSQGQLKTVWSLTLLASVTLLLPHQPPKHKLQGLCQSKAATCLGHLPWTHGPLSLQLHPLPRQFSKMGLCVTSYFLMG
jgi:hypothetical protein